MEVKCVSNQILAIPSKLRKYAFGQDENGLVDLTIGKEYKVYGVRDNSEGSFYLVLTDKVHNELPWWMPKEFFGEVKETIPIGWRTKSFGLFKTDKITSHPLYFSAISDIEDGNPKGRAVFAEMSKS